jgi:hypothetical protein
VAADKYRSSAMDALLQAHRGGQVANERELLLLKMAPELSDLRTSPEYLDLVTKMERKLQTNHLSQLAWSHAMAGNCAMANEIVEKMLATPMDDEERNAAFYNAACVYSLCFGEASQSRSEIDNKPPEIDADVFLKRSIDNLNRYFDQGNVEGKSRIEQILGDSDLAPVRETEAFQSMLRVRKTE